MRAPLPLLLAAACSPASGGPFAGGLGHAAEVGEADEDDDDGTQPASTDEGTDDGVTGAKPPPPDVGGSTSGDPLDPTTGSTSEASDESETSGDESEDDAPEPPPDPGELPDDGMWSECHDGDLCELGYACLSSDDQPGVCTIVCAPAGDPTGCPEPPGDTVELVCVGVSGGSWCAMSCEGGAPCPDGSQCVVGPDDYGRELALCL
jgi:hypothetical protein